MSDNLIAPALAVSLQKELKTRLGVLLEARCCDTEYYSQLRTSRTRHIVEIVFPAVMGPV